MLIILIIFGTINCILGILISDDHYDITIADLMAAFGGFVSVISIIAFIILASKVSKGRVIDSQIEMYQEENRSIESQMDELVKQYMQYESNTLSQFKPESSIALVSMYPELKSDALVTQQVDIYVENNKAIKELKSEKINMPVYKWWLYFGK